MILNESVASLTPWIDKTESDWSPEESLEIRRDSREELRVFPERLEVSAKLRSGNMAAVGSN